VMGEQEHEYETLQLSTPGPDVLEVTLHRPAAANALNTQMGLDLVALFEWLALEPDRHRAIVLTGAGERAFCAGGDLKERNNMTDAAWQHQHRIFERMARALLDCPLPIIAAVNGAAYGGGAEIALCCDFIYAADSARFALTEVTLGIMPGCGGTQNLARAVGERRAKEIVLTGRPFSAADAQAWSLVNAVFELPALRDAARDTAKIIAGNAPLAVRQAKQAMHAGLQLDLANALNFEIEAYNRLVPTRDRLEGVRAFNEKRKAQFRGE
jgi:enoyl-CoA hydratase